MGVAIFHCGSACTARVLMGMTLSAGPHRWSFIDHNIGVNIQKLIYKAETWVNIEKSDLIWFPV